MSLMTTKEARTMAVSIRKALLSGMMLGSGKTAMFCHAVLALDRRLTEVEKVLEPVRRARGHATYDDAVGDLEDLWKALAEYDKSDSKPKANGASAVGPEISQ